MNTRLQICSNIKGAKSQIRTDFCWLSSQYIPKLLVRVRSGWGRVCASLDWLSLQVKVFDSWCKGKDPGRVADRIQGGVEGFRRDLTNRRPNLFVPKI